MTRIVATAVALFVLAAISASCMDAEPGEVTVRPKQAGNQIDCYVMVYNEKGVQIQEDNTQTGFTRISNLKPGHYYIKLKDYGTPPTVYKAIRKIHIKTGDAQILDVDVDDISQNPPDAPASVTGGAAPAS
jgi:hypothetical protein